MTTTSGQFSKIFILPSLFTAGNLFFGFLAIIRCIQGKYLAEGAASEYYTQAVWLIMLAFVCDVLDGWVARTGGKESLFGKEFDSIADTVSFGVAPALMMYLLILSPTDQYPFFRQVGWIIGFIYLLCATVRLARFNVITHPLLPEEERITSMKEFVGLPVPAAAAFTGSIVLTMTQLNSRAIWLCMPFLMLLIAFLMVSKIPYPSFKHVLNAQTEVRFRRFIMIIGVIVVLSLFKEIAFTVLFFTYIMYGLLRHMAKNLPSKLKKHPVKKSGKTTQ